MGTIIKLSDYTNDTSGKQAKTLDQMNDLMARQFSEALRSFNMLMRLVWANPMGLTPQQVFDKWGTAGADLFDAATATTIWLNSLVPGTITSGPPYNYTINEDRSVTVGAPIVP